jgi:hypothetical protein
VSAIVAQRHQVRMSASAANVGIAGRRTEKEGAEAFPFASDDDGGLRARCASNSQIGLSDDWRGTHPPHA